MFKFDICKNEIIIKKIKEDIEDIQSMGPNILKTLKRNDKNYTDDALAYMYNKLTNNIYRLDKYINSVILKFQNKQDYNIAKNELRDKLYDKEYTGVYDLALYIFNESIEYIELDDDNISDNSGDSEEIIDENEIEPELIVKIIDVYIPEYSNFKSFTENQLDAINETLKICKSNGTYILPDFNCIHCQATGSGKTIIGLKLINEIVKLNNYNSNLTVIWFTERKSIMVDLFFKKSIQKKKQYSNISDKYDYNIMNYQMWKYHDIIDIDKFELMEFVENKNSEWYSEINKTTIKPKLVIINRTYLTLNENYKKIINNLPQLIIHDECHSAVSISTTKFYNYVQEKWNGKIIGFSATPLKAGKTNKKNNTELLYELFKNPKTNMLNILTNYNINKAIVDKIIVKPKFIINKLSKRINKREIDTTDICIIMDSLNKGFNELPYGKMIAWCGGISKSKLMYKIFKKHKLDKENNIYKYNNLYNVVEFLDNSKTDDTDYLTFYNLYNDEKKLKELEEEFINKLENKLDIGIAKHNARKEYENYILNDIIKNKKHKGIIFCAEKHREGSDIPFLDSCVFLDGCITRSSHVFIQCVGRVFRKDKYGLKTCGLVIDFFANNKIRNDELLIANKLIWYYLELENTGLNKNDIIQKIKQYNEIYQRIDLTKCTETKKIEIKCSENEKIEFYCETINWDYFGNVFDELLCKKLNMVLKDKFNAIKIKIKLLNFFDSTDYRENTKKHQLPFDPKKEFESYWVSWIDYLGIMVDDYYNIEEWISHVKINKINLIKQYKIEAKKNKKLPSMPEEFYEKFTSISKELKKISDKNNIIA